MSAQTRQRFVHRQIAWMLLGLIVLAVFDAVALDLFFSISFIGFLYLLEFTNSITIRPRWRTRLRLLLLLGLLGFGYIVYRRFQEVMGAV
jgi:hypothetical protein